MNLPFLKSKYRLCAEKKDKKNCSFNKHKYINIVFAGLTGFAQINKKNSHKARKDSKKRYQAFLIPPVLLDIPPC